jgi:hypothetical protein
VSLPSCPLSTDTSRRCAIFPLIHLGGARDGDLIVKGEADVGILDRRLRGRRADHVNELVVVGGRGPRGFRLDDLACGIFESDYGLNGSAFVPPQKRDRADDQERADPNSGEGTAEPGAESLVRSLGEVIGIYAPISTAGAPMASLMWP